MLDLVGKPYDEARTYLVQYNVAVVKRSRITPNSLGNVVEQDPVGGAPFSQKVTLTVAVAPATVPDVLRTTFGDAQTQLQALGLTVVETPTFDQAKLADGLVVAQDPPAGTANAGEVTLTVVRQPVETYLSDLQTVSQVGVNNFQTGAAKTNGTTYSHAVRSGTVNYSTQNATIEYDLSRQYRRLVADLGLLDTSSSDASYKVEIYGDNRRLYADSLTLGTAKPLKLDVTKILRLRISISGGNGIANPGESGVVLGDARVQGLPTEISIETPSPSPS